MKSVKSKQVFTAVFLSLLALPLLAGGNQEVEAQPQQDSDGFKSVTIRDMEVRWQVDGDYMHFEVTAPTTGWVSVGFNPTSAMRDADIVIGYVEGGVLTISDEFGTGRTSHRPDEELGGTDHITNASGEVQDGVTTIRFTKPIDSGDEYDVPLTPGETHRIIVAHGRDGANDLRSGHAFRGGVDVEF